MSAPTLLEPGKIDEYTIDLCATSNVFQTGDQIRVEISSSNFPRFDRNPNTGAPIGRDDRLEVAHQSVHHQEGYAPHIVLPIIPR